MPPITAVGVVDKSFTILKSESSNNLDSDSKDYQDRNEKPKNVNIVKPLYHGNVVQELMASTQGTGPKTILDPTFSKALDFKLRRLKDKENIQNPINRSFIPQRIAASNPNISKLEVVNTRRISRSHPKINKINEKLNNLKLPTMQNNSISPDRVSRCRRSTQSCDERPRFITTVKTGAFLLPPPDIATLLGLELLYPEEERQKVFSYSSKPKLLPTSMKKKVEVKKEKDRNTVKDVVNGVKSLMAGIVGFRIRRDTFSKEVNEPEDRKKPYKNLMYEKRVVRGTNVHGHPGFGDTCNDNAVLRVQQTRRRALVRRSLRSGNRSNTPPPAPGRRHHPIQTECYLEELFEKQAESEIGVQTDFFLDRPPTPIFVPAKTGVDCATQIYPNDLFDFDLEVQPILEVLVGKTLEQALVEVCREEEVAMLREQQRRFLELRDAERAERERLAEQDRRLEEEKDRRMKEAREAQVIEIETRNRCGAQMLVQGYLADLLPQVLDSLSNQGALYDKVKQGVDLEFFPWLLKEVTTEVEQIATSREVITEIVKEIMEVRGAMHRMAGERSFEALLQREEQSDSDEEGDYCWDGGPQVK